MKIRQTLYVGTLRCLSSGFEAVWSREKQCCGYMTFGVDTDPAIFVTDLPDTKKTNYVKFSCLLLYEGTFTSFIKVKKSINRRKNYQSSFFYFFCLIEESGSRRPKNIRIRWIRIRNTGEKWFQITTCMCTVPRGQPRTSPWCRCLRSPHPSPQTRPH